ncbi:MAG TPA: diacylglycerol kinase family protein [Thermoanaerobaculia bacterium]|nr:diacylglycerol kinase family protein [Thermoanaerobaculia bacterium]
MRRAALIYNPNSGRRRNARLLDRVLAACRQGGFEVEPVKTDGPGAATGLARALAGGGSHEAILALGGDGTVREVAAGLLGSEVVLGVLPGGTVNLLARALGLPGDPVAAAAALGRLPPRPLDVGLAGDCPFLMMTSAGLDARMLAVLDQDSKARFGKWAVLYQGLREWWRYPYPRLDILADGEPLEASFAAVLNIPYYAGPFRMAPAARPDDRRLDLVLFQGSGRPATAAFALAVIAGRHLRRGDVAVRSVREVVLRAPAEAALQVDGDHCGERPPAHIRLAPQQLRVLAPAGAWP